MNPTFVSLITPPEEITDGAYWFIFHNHRLLIQNQGDNTNVPFLANISNLDLPIIRTHYMGYVAGDPKWHCFVGEIVEDVALPEGMAFVGLRSLYNQIGDEMFWLGGRAVQIVDWDRTHQFCGRCGQETEYASDRGKKCPNCGLSSYPKLSPAIIVSITRNDGAELLLARGARHPSGFYSVLAGFVEPGETLETCVRREIMEEVGLDVKNVRYFGSQPWPFPNSLMIAFTCEYAGGEIVMQEEEIADAGWFTPNNMPQVPPSLSISRALIDDFVANWRDGA